MNKHGMKIAACALAGTFALSGYQMTLEARINRSANIPAAGIAVVLDEGSTIQDLQVEVVQNIAYLESVSGIQPNILNAAKKSVLADTSANGVLAQNIPAEQAESVENQDNGEISGQSETVQDARETNVNDESVENRQSEDNQTLESQEEENQEQNSQTIEEQSSQTVETQEQESQTLENQEQNNQQSTEQQEESSVDDTNPESMDESTSENDTSDRDQESETFEEDVLSENTQTSVGFSAIELYEAKEVEETSTEEETKEEEQDFSGLVIARVNNYVNVRSMPSEDGEIVGKLYDKSVGEFIEEQDGWYKIKSGNCTGFVKGEFCVVGEEAEQLAKEVGTTYAIVNTTTLKVRKEASTESAVLGLVPIGEELIVVEELDGWVKIAIEEGDGYVSRDYVNLRTDFVCAESREEEEARLAKEAQEREQARAAATAAEASRAKEKAKKESQDASKNEAVIAAAQSTAAASQGSEIGKAVIDYATQFVGYPYVYGGSSLTNGTDCSGFVMSVYANFGVSLPHSSSALRSKGYDVGGLENAQPGDIVCYSGHVGLYVGNGQIVHASTSKTGIIVSSATYRNILSVRRIF